MTPGGTIASGLRRALVMICLLLSGIVTAHAQGIPLEKGLVLVYEGHDPGDGARRKAGYLERLVTVADKTADVLRQNIEFNDHVGDTAQAQTTVLEKVVRLQDMQTAHRLIFQFLQEDPPTLPGSTLFHASKELLNRLVNTGTAALVFGDGLPSEHGGFFNVGSRKYYRGDLKVVEQHVPMDVLFNDSKIALDTIHAHGVLSVADMSTEQDFWFSRDMDNPVIVRAQGKEGNYIQLVRADFLFPPADAAKVEAVDTALAGPECRAKLPGIYFGSGSDVLLPASKPALQGVGDMLKRHEDWAITVEGHTDNVGTDAFNMDLSNRRAAAVRRVLISDYAITAGRLAAAGYGETRPVDSNETPVGRANNRRVELSRKCK